MYNPKSDFRHKINRDLVTCNCSILLSILIRPSASSDLQKGLALSTHTNIIMVLDCFIEKHLLYAHMFGS